MFRILPLAFAGVAAATAPATAAPCSVANCQTCSASDANLCLTCKHGFGLDGGACFDATVSCWNELFNQRTGINKDGTCCQALNCMECGTSSQCTQCFHGFFLNNRGQCAECPTFNDGKDAMCKGGKGCFAATPMPTSCCAENCAVCDGIGACTICLNGEAGPTCSTCVEGNTRFGCAVCQDGKCEACMPEFTMTQWGCRPCPEMCREGCGHRLDGMKDEDFYCCSRVNGNCQACDINAAICQACDMGFYSYNYQCERCHESCANTCRTFGEHGGPRADYCCPANCAVCDDNGCNVCFGGFTMDRATRTCS